MIDFNIEKGKLEYYYCFEIPQKNKIDYISKKLSEDISNMIDSDIEGVDIKEEYKKYFSEQIEEVAYSISNNIESKIGELDISNVLNAKTKRYNYKDISVQESTLGLDDINIFIDNSENRLRIGFTNRIEEDILKELNNFLYTVIEDRRYLGKEIIHELFFLKPLVIDFDGIKKNVYLWATIHSSGQLILKYSIELENISSDTFYTEKFRNKYKCKVPSYVLGKNKIDYDSKEIFLKEAIDMYNSYIIKKINKYKKVISKNEIFFENLILEEYDNKPQNFNEVSKDMKEAFFFIVNRPYGYVNTRYGEEYDAFIKNRYDMSRFASIFCGTSGRTLIAFNKDFESLPEEVRECVDKSKIASTYLSGALKLLMIRRSYYDEIFENVYDEMEHDTKYLRKLQRKMLFSEDYTFFNLKKSYGTVKLLYNYMEKNMTDFFPKDMLDKKIELYSKIIESNEQVDREKLNKRIGFGTTIITIFFGISGIEQLVKLSRQSIDRFLLNAFGENTLQTIKLYLYNVKNSFHLLNGVNITFLILIMMCVFIIIYFNTDKILRLMKFIIVKIKIAMSIIKVLIDRRKDLPKYIKVKFLNLPKYIKAKFLNR